MMAGKKPLVIVKGSTFLDILRLETSEKVYRTITNITNTAPVVITCPAHFMPSRWRVKITDVNGMTNINSTEEYKEAKVLTTDTIEINSINAVSFKPYTSGGVVEFYKPFDLTGYSATLQIRDNIDSEAVLLQLSTADSTISIDYSNSSIKLEIPASVTQNLAFSSGVYLLELYAPNGYIQTILEGKVTVKKEVTRGLPGDNAP